MTDRVTTLRSFALQAAKAQNWPEAIDQMRQAIELCGQCSHGALLHKNLTFLYRRTGRIGDAEAELQKAIALDPNDENARKALAELATHLNTQPQ
jgi:tetratricopeptide (TPR) repeat protein